MRGSETASVAGPLSLDTPVSAWAASLSRGDRRALSRLITFAESSRADHQALVDAVLSETRDTGAFRIGVSGAPGAGKSTLLESLGKHLIEQGKQVGVLTIDPSSRVSGGSILADKTRMTGLSTAQAAFVRPSPSGLGQGGICAYTSKSLDLCDRAGFDFVFLETVGVGQTELDAVSLVDCFVMIVSPSGGDELQGMKRGITEHADILVVNKLDQDPELAQRTCLSYAGALHLLRGREVPALTVSAQKNLHIDMLWQLLNRFCSELAPEMRSARKEQDREREFWRVLLRAFEHTTRARSQTADDVVATQLKGVQDGRLSAAEAANQVLFELLAPSNSRDL
jgi:LAO/AO transport system kinase